MPAITPQFVNINEPITLGHVLYTHPIQFQMFFTAGNLITCASFISEGKLIGFDLELIKFRACSNSFRGIWLVSLSGF